jgi:hypothetical protein
MVIEGGFKQRADFGGTYTKIGTIQRRLALKTKLV